MNEERWHNFAKEKPSEDMEGRNFIVSNGHYEKIATWCGYWENEPFMGDHLCDEVVRWKFYFTPEEEKANEATHTYPKAMKCDELKEYKAYEYGTSYVYDIGEVKEAIAELKQKLEDVQASAYTESVDAGMRERRLKRALWLTRGYIMTLLHREFQRLAYQCNNDDYKKNLLRRRNRFYDLYEKCLKKSEEYK